MKTLDLEMKNDAILKNMAAILKLAKIEVANDVFHLYTTQGAFMPNLVLLSLNELFSC